MAAFTEIASAVSQIFILHHHRQASDLKTLTVKMLYLGDYFYCLLLHWFFCFVYPNCSLRKRLRNCFDGSVVLLYHIYIYIYMHTPLHGF